MDSIMKSALKSVLLKEKKRKEKLKKIMVSRNLRQAHLLEVGLT